MNFIAPSIFYTITKIPNIISLSSQAGQDGESGGPAARVAAAAFRLDGDTAPALCVRGTGSREGHVTVSTVKVRFIHR